MNIIWVVIEIQQLINMNCNKECVFLMNNENKWTGNNIGDEGANKISESLKINTTLTQLDLWSNWNTTINKNEW